jgi:hypothetical protein
MKDADRVSEKEGARIASAPEDQSG